MNVRRFLWGVLAVALVVMVAMAYLQSRVAREKTAAAEAATRPGGTPAQGATRGNPPATATASAPAPAWGNTREEPHERVLGSDQRPRDKTKPYYRLRVELTSLGAGIKTIRLADFWETVADKRRCQRDPETYPQAVRDDPKLRGQYVLLRPAGSGDETTYPLATRRVRFPDFQDESLGLSGPRWVAGEVATDKDGTQRVTFTSTIYREGKDFLRLEKTYSLAKDSNSIQVALGAVNLTDRKVSVALTQLGPTGVRQEDFRADRRAFVYARQEPKEVKIFRSDIGKAKEMPPGLKAAAPIGRSDTADPVLWIGQSNKFFAALAYVEPDEGEGLAAGHAKVEFACAAIEDAPGHKTHLGVMELGPYEIPPGESVAVRLDLFAGPKKLGLFDGSPLYKALRYKDTIDFGSCFCAPAALSLGMLWLLELFSKAALGNYGVAIILLVVVVRLVLHPLTRKSQASMSRMQKLQPEMAKVREKYKDDKPRLNEEMMKLYKAQGITPMLGCLPMLLQMPIWIALWTALQAAVELRHAAFLPVWITDLAAPDNLIPFASVVHVPCIGSFLGPVTGFNLLPLLLCVAMVIQQRLTPSASTSDQQARTQKSMMYFMSGFFLLIFYNAPSGLTLYIMASTFAGVGEQYVIRRHIRQKEAEEGAAETRVAVPGGHFRGQKPKKPKGPFRFMR